VDHVRCGLIRGENPLFAKPACGFKLAHYRATLVDVFAYYSPYTGACLATTDRAIAFTCHSSSVKVGRFSSSKQI
jgi:hypothetical protein